MHDTRCCSLLCIWSTIHPYIVPTYPLLCMVVQLDATGRPDESLSVELVGPLQSTSEENIAGKLLSFSLQKGHLKVNACYRPLHSTNLEVLFTFFPCLLVFLFNDFIRQNLFKLFNVQSDTPFAAGWTGASLTAWGNIKSKLLIRLLDVVFVAPSFEMVWVFFNSAISFLMSVVLFAYAV